MPSGLAAAYQAATTVAKGVHRGCEIELVYERIVQNTSHTLHQIVNVKGE